MVATRRVTRRSESKAGSPAVRATAKQPAMEDDTPMRTTRSRSRMISQAKSISKCHPAEQPLEAHAHLNTSKAGGLADAAAELQADGDFSEAESTCSSVSGLQTPLFVRITRRRQIVIPCPPETSLKNRQNRKAVPNEGISCQDNDDVSETESCSSVLSGMRNPRSARKSRRQQIKVHVSPVCEVQPEEVSDAESWCSGVSLETSGAFKRVTRSMQLKLQATSQTERKNNVLGEDEEVPECAVTSQAIVISDSEEPTVSDLDAREALSVWMKEHPSPSKTKQLSKSLATNDPKQIFSSCHKAMASECNNDLSDLKKPKDGDYELEHTVEVQSERAIRKSISKQISVEIYEKMETPEEVCDQPFKKNKKITANQLPSEIIAISPCDPGTLDQSNESSVKARSNKKMRLKSKKVIKSCLYHREDIIKIDESSEVDSPSSQTLKNSDGCRSSATSTDSDGSLKEAVAESSSRANRITGHQKDVSISLLTSDESDELGNSDLANVSEMTVDYVEENSQSTLGEGRSNSEELFVIDKTPGLDSHKEYYFEDKQSKDSSELEESEEEFIDEDEDVLNTNNEVVLFSSSIDPGLNVKQFGGLYITFDSGKQSHGVLPLKEKKKDELLQKSIITPNFEKKECVPPLRESVHQLKKQRRAERAKTTGDGWFGMKAPEMTDELKNDLKALKMRAAIDPKRFYKKNDREGLPRYFQIGTVVDTPADFYHARIPKKERKKTIVEELLADSEFRRYNKRKYQDIIAEKAALAAGKKNRKKKKFHK